MTYSGADTPTIMVIGAGVGGLTTAALLAKQGYRVTVLEGQTYAGGCAGTFFHKGYRFDAGATLAGGFQPNGPHNLIAQWLDIDWPVHQAETAWVVHLPGHSIALGQDPASILENFPQSAAFWQDQHRIADLCWHLAAQGLPWPPQSLTEFVQLVKVGLRNFPADVRLIRLALGSVQSWLKRHHLDNDIAFKRFIDAQLLISAQTTSQHANGLYGATALDLARQGVQHVTGGMGGIADTLVDKIRQLGGEVRFRHTVTRIPVENGRATGVMVKHGQHGKAEFLPADMVIANLTPWSLDKLLGENSPTRLRQEVQKRGAGWGAFVLHVGLRTADLPMDMADHHQIIPNMEGPLGEGNSIFVSMSPAWDATRAPHGQRAVTITTHTQVQPWWDMLERDEEAYQSRKMDMTLRLLDTIDATLPGFRQSLEVVLSGTPVTYNFYTQRHLGMVGGFPQRSLFGARGPRVGLKNVRLVGDSIFPGQSTAGVTLGAIRVAQDVQRAVGVAVPEALPTLNNAEIAG